MTLPDDFKFVAEHCTITYTAKLVDGLYKVTWYETSDEREAGMNYPVLTVARLIKESKWTILPESFPQLITLSEGLQALISEKKDASDLAYDELKSLLLTRALITRLLDDR